MSMMSMSFNVIRKDFLSAVNSAIRAVSSRTTLPVLEGLLIEANNEEIRITGNNLEIGIMSKAKATVENEGKIVTNAKLLYNILKLLPDADINFTVKENNEILLTCLLSEYTLKGVETSGFPAIPEVEALQKMKLSASTFKNMLSRTLFATSKDEHRPILTGILVETSNDNLNVVAVDGFRLAHSNSSTEENLKTDTSIVIPSKTANELIKTLPNDGDVIISIQDNIALFEYENTKITSNLLEGQYINYKSIVPKDFNTMLVINRKEFLGAVERSMLIADTSNSTNPLRLDIIPENGSVRLSAKSSTGNMNEELKIQGKGANVTIYFNPLFIAEGLRAINNDIVAVGAIDSVNPIIIQAPEYLYMALPVRMPAEEKKEQKEAA
jgi:DNA polymerase-3 subunit beta